MGKFLIQCIDCGRIGKFNIRCAACTTVKLRDQRREQARQRIERMTPEEKLAFYKHNALTKKYRQQVLDRANNLCEICGKPGTPNDPLTVDHIVPRALGGESAMHNFRAIHRSENSALGARTGASIQREGK